MNLSIGIKKAAALCILQHKQKFLLLKRKNDPNKGMYAPVGGKLNPFESPLRAAIRETYEETGIRLSKMRFCGVLTESSPTKYNWISFLYHAELDLIEPPSCAEGVLEWIEQIRLPAIPMPPTDEIIYQYILQQKIFCFSAVYDKKLNLLNMVEEFENIQIYPRK